MSPQRNPIKKALITKTTDGRLHVAVVGEISRPAVFKEPSFASPRSANVSPHHSRAKVSKLIWTVCTHQFRRHANGNQTT
jgi:hypothetical protein